jgi:hypothetical protein
VVVDKIIDAQFTTQHVMLQVKYNFPNNNASDAKHAQLDNNSLEMFAKFQDLYANALKNIMPQPTDVTDAELVHSPEMDSMVDKMVDAKHGLHLVPKTIKSNKDKIHAMHVPPVLVLIKLLLVMHVLLEFHAAAGKSMFQLLTLVEHAHQVKLLMVPLEDVPNSPLVATNKDWDNWHNNNAINAKHAQLDNNWTPRINVLHQDQPVPVTNLLTQTTNVKLAQLVNFLMQVEIDVSHKPTPVTQEIKSEEINSTAMHALSVPDSHFQTQQELHVLPDHLLPVDVWAEEMPLDTNASTVELDKLLIQPIQTNALPKLPVIHSHTDSQEMPPHVVDAKDVTGHLKSQTQ